MSTIKVNTIQDAAGADSSTPNQIQQGRAKAWCNFNGTGMPAYRDSFGFNTGTGVIDNGVGDYTLTFSTAMPNANYSVCGSQDNGTSGAAMAPMIKNANPPTTTTLRLQFANGNGTAIDSAYNSVQVFGD